MRFPRYLFLALVMFFKLTHANPLGLAKRQDASGTYNIDINFCMDYEGGGTCTNIATYTDATSDTDNHVTSNFATLVNTDFIYGISSVTVSGDSGAWCVFGYQVLSITPEIICGGWSASINTGDPTYSFGANNPDGAINDNLLCFFCAAQG